LGQATLEVVADGMGSDRPFCVNLALDFEHDERLEVAVEERATFLDSAATTEGAQPATPSRCHQ